MNTLINPLQESGRRSTLIHACDDKPFGGRWKMNNHHPYNDQPFVGRWKMNNPHPCDDKPF